MMRFCNAEFWVSEALGLSEILRILGPLAYVDSVGQTSDPSVFSL